jgi:hypothetical protein
VSKTNENNYYSMYKLLAIPTFLHSIFKVFLPFRVENEILMNFNILILFEAMSNDKHIILYMQMIIKVNLNFA